MQTIYELSMNISVGHGQHLRIQTTINLMHSANPLEGAVIVPKHALWLITAALNQIKSYLLATQTKRERERVVLFFRLLMAWLMNIKICLTFCPREETRQKAEVGIENYNLVSRMQLKFPSGNSSQ